MRVILNCLSTGYKDVYGEYLLECESCKYLFNVGDGTQRLCNEYSLRLSKLQSIFITKVTPETLGGLPGMLLSIYDMGVRKIAIYGPEGLARYMETLQLFIFRPDYSISVVEIENDIEQIELKDGVFIRPYVLHTHPNSQAFVREERHITGIIDLSISAVHRTTTPHYGEEISYLIDIPTIRGRFCPEKAIALGVPKGILFKTLASGGSVVVNGQTITSEMVTTSVTQGPSLLLLSLHSQETVNAFQNSRLAQALQQESFTTSLVGVLHSSPFSLRATPAYLALLQQFQQKNTTEKVIAHLTLPNTMEIPLSVHQSSSVLHRHMHTITPALFPALVSQDGVNSLQTERNGEESETQHTIQWQVMEHRSTIVLPPKNPAMSIVNPPVPIKPKQPNTVDLDMATSYYKSLLETVPKATIPGAFLFLGTGSAVPSKYRNVASILYFPSSSSPSSFLLDCGEGMPNQLLRIAENDITALTSIKAVLLSHSHADHHLGLPLLLTHLVALKEQQENHQKDDPEHASKRVRVENLPLRIVGPPRVRAFLEMWETLLPSLKGSYVYVDVTISDVCRMKEWNSNAMEEVLQLQQHEYQAEKSNFLSKDWISYGMKISVDPTGAFDVEFVDERLLVRMIPAIHCDDSVCTFIRNQKTGRMVVYSGDGLPADGVVEAMIPADWNADVLLNECTFSDERQEQAEAKSHCSLRDAVRMLKRVRAKYLVLTHFSQRYPKSLSHDQGMRTRKESEEAIDDSIEKIAKDVRQEEEENEDEPPYCFAHDLMRIEFTELPVICQFRELFEQCFLCDDD